MNKRVTGQQIAHALRLAERNAPYSPTRAAACCGGRCGKSQA